MTTSSSPTSVSVIAILVTVQWLAVAVGVVSGEATFRRACGCERSSDGKCSYLLQVDADITNGGGGSEGGDRSRYDEIGARIDALKRDATSANIAESHLAARITVLESGSLAILLKDSSAAEVTARNRSHVTSSDLQTAVEVAVVQEVASLVGQRFRELGESVANLENRLERLENLPRICR